MLSRQLEAPYSPSLDIEPCDTEELMLKKLKLLHTTNYTEGRNCHGPGAGNFMHHTETAIKHSPYILDFLRETGSVVDYCVTQSM